MAKDVFLWGCLVKPRKNVRLRYFYFLHVTFPLTFVAEIYSCFAFAKQGIVSDDYLLGISCGNTMRLSVSLLYLQYICFVVLAVNSVSVNMLVYV